MGWTGAINAKVRATKLGRIATNAPDPPHWTLNSTFVAFRSDWVRLGLICYDSKLIAKWAELVQLMQKFMRRSCIGCFRNERTWSTPLDPKLNFCCVLKCLGAFGTISLLHETRWKLGWTGAINAKVRAQSRVGCFHNERTQSTPLEPKLSATK